MVIYDSKKYPRQLKIVVKFNAVTIIITVCMTMLSKN